MAEAQRIERLGKAEDGFEFELSTDYDFRLYATADEREVVKEKGFDDILNHKLIIYIQDGEVRARHG